ncbi:MAG: hypothetical protein QF570_00940 [Myxococcota bacterium]|nr:hypothetical protein [Myxococcota bacterium]
MVIGTALLAIVFSLAFTSCQNASSSSDASGGCGLEGCKIVAPDPNATDTFAFGVAIDGDKMVAGSIVDDPSTDAGAAYVFAYEDGDWLVEQKIQHTTPVPVGGDFFGNAVAMQGDRIAVGAQGVESTGAEARAGSVFIFEFDSGSWSQVQRIEAPDAALDDRFGVSVDLDGDWLVVGSYLDDDNNSASGSVYVFEHDGLEYVFDEKLNMQNNSGNDRFGVSVAVDGDILVAGALNDNFFFTGNESGSAGVFRHDDTDWIHEGFTANDALVGDTFAPFDHFGTSVDIDDGVIVVGAPGVDGDEEDEGIVWVYRFDGGKWSHYLDDNIETIRPSDPSESKLFGNSVSIEGNRVIVGAKLDDEEGQRAGATYVFEYEGGEWVEQHKLTAPDATTGDNFGVSAVVSGDTIIVGAPLAGPGNDASGAAYGFEL